MVRVKVALPYDLTFLSELLYEGLLYSIKRAQVKKVSSTEIELPDSFLQNVCESLSDDVKDISLPTTSNDNLDALCKRLGVKLEKRNFGDLIFKVKKQSSKLVPKKSWINLQLSFDKKDGKKCLLIDPYNKEDLFTFQIFKVDRYTGISSLEEMYTELQIPTYLSFETTIISLFGLSSSYISKLDNYHYFLFFSPDEISTLVSNPTSTLVEKYFRIKDEVKRSIREYIANSSYEEVLLLELMLSTNVQRLVLQENLDRVSLVLFKVAFEGKTYKIYETVPLTFYKESVFNKNIEKYIEEPEKFLSYISEKILDPKGIIVKTLSSLSKGKPATEANNVLLAIQSLYRFVIFGNIVDLYMFIRELQNAYEKLKKEDLQRANKYANIVKSISYYL